MTGYTHDAATDLPATPGAYDTTHNGDYDAFVSRLDRNLSRNTWYIASMGGSNAEGKFIFLGLTATNGVRICYYDTGNRNLRYGYTTTSGGEWTKGTPDSKRTDWEIYLSGSKEIKWQSLHQLL